MLSTDWWDRMSGLAVLPMLRCAVAIIWALWGPAHRWPYAAALAAVNVVLSPLFFGDLVRRHAPLLVAGATLVQSFPLLTVPTASGRFPARRQGGSSQVRGLTSTDPFMPLS